MSVTASRAQKVAAPARMAERGRPSLVRMMNERDVMMCVLIESTHAHRPPSQGMHIDVGDGFALRGIVCDSEPPMCRCAGCARTSHIDPDVQADLHIAYSPCDALAPRHRPAGAA